MPLADHRAGRIDQHGHVNRTVPRIEERNLLRVAVFAHDEVARRKPLYVISLLVHHLHINCLKLHFGADGSARLDWDACWPQKDALSEPRARQTNAQPAVIANAMKNRQEMRRTESTE